MRIILAAFLAIASLAGCDDGSGQGGSAQGGASTATTAPTDQASPAASPRKARSTELAAGTPTDLFFLDWGGDAATLDANGGPVTTKGSTMDRLGLNFRLVDGNSVREQVEAYKAGTTPYLRLTTQQAADVASELCGDGSDICPVPWVQLTWSAGGDHLVAVERIRTIADLTGGVRIGLQDYGPHGGLLVDVVEKDAKLPLDKVTIVKAPNLSGSDSPVTLLQQGKADAVFVITPDRDGLTSGNTVGDGGEGSVKGAHEILSTAERTRSIADLYYVNPRFLTAHPDQARAFQVAVLMGQERVVEMRKAYDAGGSEDYRALLAELGDLMGSLPDGSEADAAGLIADCGFVGHPGNVAFFADASNPTGWSYFNKATASWWSATPRAMTMRRSCAGCCRSPWTATFPRRRWPGSASGPRATTPAPSRRHAGHRGRTAVPAPSRLPQLHGPPPASARLRRGVAAAVARGDP